MKINTYRELKEYLRAFNEGEINLLIIESKGGLGKSHLTESIINDCLSFKGHATPLSIYMKLLKNPLKKVVFDDVDTLLNNKTSVALLKQICETKKNKQISYNTSLSNIQDFEPEFRSNNRVLLLTNDTKRLGRNIKALLTRSIFIDFRPSHSEILNQLKEFAKDDEVYSYLKAKSQEIRDLNFRIYHKCVELKNCGIDWMNYLSSEYSLNSDMDLIRKIIHLPVKERNSIWIRETETSVQTLRKAIRRYKAQLV